MSDNSEMNNTHYVKGKVHATSDIIWETLYYQGVIDIEIHKSKYHWSHFHWSTKIKVKGDNIETIYNMIPYK